MGSNSRMALCMRAFPGERGEGELLAERREEASEQECCRGRERGAGRGAGCEEAAAAAAAGGERGALVLASLCGVRGVCMSAMSR
jgi:hypothetical protein